METDPAEATSTPVLQSTAAGGSSGGGGGGGGGLDREGSKGIPAGYLLPITGSWVPRRPGLGCGGVGGSCCGGYGLGRGETMVY